MTRYQLQLHAWVSIHAFRGEGDALHAQRRCRQTSFNPRLPGGRRLRYTFRLRRLRTRFNPRLPGGRRLSFGFNVSVGEPFQSTPSGGKATEAHFGIVRASDVSIHAFRGEGDEAHFQRRAVIRTVSIHAFRGEGDLGVDVDPDITTVSIHAFRGEGDSIACCDSAEQTGFNPRLPGGRRLERVADASQLLAVSIHAFRGEGDAA